MSVDRFDLIMENIYLKEENKKLDYLYHKSLADYEKNFDELQKHKVALNKACGILTRHVTIVFTGETTKFRTKEWWIEFCLKGL